MMNNNNYKGDAELTELCNKVREFIGQKKYHESEYLIKNAMAKFPHAPQPHNLMGIQLESRCDHIAAMKHFRAAWALDPTYLPARININQFADIFCKNRKYAYAEEDCPKEQERDLYKTEYNENGIGHIVKRDKSNKINNER